MVIFVALGFLTGTSVLNVCSTLPPPVNLIIGCGILASISLVLWLKKAPLYKAIALYSLSVAFGFGWAYFAAAQKLQWQFPLEDMQKRITLCGKVDGITLHRENALRFDIVLHEYQGKVLKTQGAKIRLHWHQPRVNLRDNDYLCANVKLKPRWSLSNPGGFDQEKQYFLEGIGATGKVIALVHYQASTDFSLNKWRQQLNDNLAVILQDKPFLGVIQATTLGIYHHIDPKQWQIFQATGTVHAIAISGMHISVIALLCGGWVTFLARRFSRLTNIMPAKCYGAIFALIGALIYSSLAGFSIPTQRALVMILISIVALLKRQPLLTWQSLALACIGVLLVDPLAPLQIGFWLSFACVAALIYGGSRQASTGWRKWVMPQWSVFVGLIPLGAFYFQQISWISPLANMLTLPVIDLLVVPCCLLGLFLSFLFPFLAKLCFSLANTALECVSWFLEKLTMFPFHIQEIGQLPGPYILLGIGCVLVLIAPSGIPGRRWASLGLLPLLLYQPPRLQEGECLFTLLDVGQGLAAVIQTKDHALLFDTGPIAAGPRAIVPFMRASNIKFLDKVIISHSDLDHRGGLDAIAQNRMGEILSSEPQRLKQVASPCFAGLAWEWDGVKFSILNPSQLDATKRNDLSCVLKVTSRYHSVLLSGDIEHRAEQALLKTYGNVLESTILVVPHHGSLTSSSLDFIQAVRPKYALFAVGLGNQYGFPKQAVIKRYKEAGAKNLLVSSTGALVFRLGKQETLSPPVGWRAKTRRYWHRTL